MSKPKVLVGTEIFGEQSKLLCSSFDVIKTEHELEMDEIVKLSKEHSPDGIIICMMPCGKDVIDQLPASVKIIATISVGYDHIDLAACRNRNITVANTPVVLTECTADIGMLLLLRAVQEASLQQQSKEAADDKCVAPWRYSVYGRQFCIAGMGRIGQSMAKKAASLGMKVAYHNRNRLPAELEEACAAEYVDSLPKLLERADVLSINCPANPAGSAMLTAENIQKMRRNSIVVNCARGKLVDEEALMSALHTGHIAAAGLDVFQKEPGTPSSNPLLGMKNVVAFPHAGSATIETRKNMVLRAVTNVHDFFNGKAPTDIVSA